MRSFVCLIKSEALRMRHTTLLKIHLILPAAGAAVFLVYYSFSRWDSAGKVLGYLQVVSSVWPFLCGLICGMSEEMEADCGYQNFFLLPGRKFQALLSKWLVLLGAGLAACLIAVMGFAVVYYFYPEGDVYSMAVYLEAALAIWLGQTVVYLMHLMLALCFGKTVSIGTGIAGTLLACLMLTGLGDGIWMWFPWAWSGRFASYLLLYTGRSSGQVLSLSVKGELWFCLAASMIIAGLIFLWFTGYEGRRVQE